MIACPILKRDLAAFLRSRWAFLLLLAALLLIAAAIIQRWGALRYVWMQVTTEQRQEQALSDHGRHLFRALMRGQLVVISFLAALSSAASVAGERERDTLMLLLSSPVRLSRLVIEKYLSSQLYVLVVVVACVPVLSLSLLARGLAADEVVAAQLLSVVAALGYGMLGLFCSTLRPKVYETYLIAVVVILAVTLLIPFGPSVWHYVLTTRWYHPPEGLHGLLDISPFMALDRIVPPSSRSMYAGRPFVGLFIYGAAWSAIAFALFWASCWRLSVLAGGGRVRRAGTANPSPASADPHPEPSREDSGPSLWEWPSTPPVLQLERHRQWFGRLGVLLRLLYLALLISVITLPLASQGGSWLFFTMPFLAAALFTVPLSATALGSERDAGTLDILRTTLIGDRAIIGAKYTVALQLSLLLSLALYLPGLLTMLIYGPILGHDLDLLLDSRDVFPLLSHPLLLASSLALYNALGVWFSSRFRSVNIALMTTTLSVLLLLMLPLPALHVLSGMNLGSLESGSRWLLLSGAVAPLIASSPFAILVLLSTEGNIALVGLQVSAALAPFRATAPLFLAVYGILACVAAWRLIRRAEHRL